MQYCSYIYYLYIYNIIYIYISYTCLYLYILCILYILYYAYYTHTHNFKFLSTHKLKREGWETTFHTDVNQRKEAATFISDKIHIILKVSKKAKNDII